MASRSASGRSRSRSLGARVESRSGVAPAGPVGVVGGVPDRLDVLGAEPGAQLVEQEGVAVGVAPRQGDRAHRYAVQPVGEPVRQREHDLGRDPGGRLGPVGDEDGVGVARCARCRWPRAAGPGRRPASSPRRGRLADRARSRPMPLSRWRCANEAAFDAGRRRPGELTPAGRWGWTLRRRARRRRFAELGPGRSARGAAGRSRLAGPGRRRPPSSWPAGSTPSSVSSTSRSTPGRRDDDGCAHSRNSPPCAAGRLCDVAASKPRIAWSRLTDWRRRRARFALDGLRLVGLRGSQDVAGDRGLRWPFPEVVQCQRCALAPRECAGKPARPLRPVSPLHHRASPAGSRPAAGDGGRRGHHPHAQPCGACRPCLASCRPLSSGRATPESWRSRGQSATWGVDHPAPTGCPGRRPWWVRPVLRADRGSGSCRTLWG